LGTEGRLRLGAGSGIIIEILSDCITSLRIDILQPLSCFTTPPPIGQGGIPFDV